MADQRRGGIAWTDETLNPIRARHRVTGKIGWYCQRVSDGCKHCYAATMNEWRGNGVDYTVPALKDVEVFLDPKILAAPLGWRRPRRVFLCSMTDLFADFVPDEWIDRIFAVMALAPQHVFQVLTKRPERMAIYLGTGDREDRIEEAIPPMTACHADLDRLGRWPLPNVWLGVSVESRKHLDRLDLLRQTPAAVRFVSFEPLLEDLGDVDLTGIDQAIYGGESGPSARPCDVAWIRRGIACCRNSGTATFVKQLGARPYSMTGAYGDRYFGAKALLPQPGEEGRWYLVGEKRDRAGTDPSEWPEDLRDARAFPRGPA